MAGWGRRFRIAIQGRDPRNKRPFIWHLFQARPGGGASLGRRRLARRRRVAGGRRHQVRQPRSHRGALPAVLQRHEFRPDSGGDGQYRGGPGGIVEMVVETAEPALGNTAGDGVRHGACGILGGADGAPHRYMLHSGNREPRAIKTKETGLVIRPGDGSCSNPAAAAAGATRARRPDATRAYDAGVRRLSPAELRRVGAAEPHRGCLSLSRRGVAMYRIGIDVGGTFTDLVAVDAGGAATLAKVPSTPDDPSLGVLDGLAALARGSASTARRCSPRPSASSTAPRSRPTRCWSTRAREPGFSPPRAIATSSRCARG